MFANSAEKIWLRENCQCGVCYDGARSQRRVSFFKLSEESFNIKEVKESEESSSNKQYFITWADGHVSQFDDEWIKNNRAIKLNLIPKFLWNAENIKSYLKKEAVTHDKMHSANNEMYIKMVCEDMHRYGFVIIKNVPLTQEDMMKTAEKVSEMRLTFYGLNFLLGIDDEMVVSPKEGVLKDTAYDNDDLQVHTDGTYFNESVAFVVFLFIKASNKGGETVLVDSFNAANQLLEKSPKLIDSLANNLVTFNYKDDNRHYCTRTPIIGTDPVSGEFVCVRYNHLDRGTHKSEWINCLSSCQTNVTNGEIPLIENKEHKKEEESEEHRRESTFYEALSKFSRLIENTENELVLKLEEGDLLIVDNWRVLHGRKAYVPPRVLASCFLHRDQYLSNLRM